MAERKQIASSQAGDFRLFVYDDGSARLTTPTHVGVSGVSVASRGSRIDFSPVEAPTPVNTSTATEDKS